MTCHYSGDVMRDFISEIKRINTDGVIFEFSKASIEMFHDKQCQKPFDIMVTSFGITKKRHVLLCAWDIQDIAYLSVTHSSDHRRKDNLPSMGQLINLYRDYANKNSIADQLQHSNIDRIFRAILGMSAEQFQYENISWIYEKFNRDYYILQAAKHFTHRSLLDADTIFSELFGISLDEFVMVLLMIFGLCSRSPMPLEHYDRIDTSELPKVLSRENIEKVLEYYTCTYKDIRNSALGKQIFYSKPFIKTKKDSFYICCSMYLVAMLIGNSLYWICRDYYHNDKQYFPDTFGLLFEDYIKDLSSRCCEEHEWGVIPHGKTEGADFYYDIGSIRVIIEAKSALLQLGAKQQVPNLDAVDIYYKRNIEKSYKQLNASFEDMQKKTSRQVVKVTLLYDDFSNTSIVERSASAISDQDPSWYVMSIRELEILLNLHKYNKAKCNEICDSIIAHNNDPKERKSIGAILDHMDLTCNPLWVGDLDSFSKITDQLFND